MAVDIEAIHEGLATAASTVSGLRSYAALPAAINPPVFAVTEFELSYHGTFGSTRGLTEFMFTCGVFSDDSDAGRKVLLPFISPNGTSSVPAALESDKTLGGACKTLVVQRVRGAYRIYEVGNNSYIGAMIDVKVWA